MSLAPQKLAHAGKDPRPPNVFRFLLLDQITMLSLPARLKSIAHCLVVGAGLPFIALDYMVTVSETQRRGLLRYRSVWKLTVRIHGLVCTDVQRPRHHKHLNCGARRGAWCGHLVALHRGILCFWPLSICREKRRRSYLGKNQDGFLEEFLEQIKLNLSIFVMATG
jgi:hypothetical protein